LLLTSVRVTVVYPITRTIPANTQVRFVNSKLYARYTLHETDPDNATLPAVLTRDTTPPIISVNLAQTLLSGVWDATTSTLTLPTLSNSNFANVSASHWVPLVTDVGGMFGSSYSPDIVTYPFPIGTTTVTVTASDTSLNQATRQFSIVVQDVEAPRMWCFTSQGLVDCTLQSAAALAVTEVLPVDAALVTIESRRLIPTYICDNSCTHVCDPQRLETHRCGVIETDDVEVAATYRFNNSKVLSFKVRLTA
jgi:hypothetical protein